MLRLRECIELLKRKNIALLVLAVVLRVLLHGIIRQMNELIVQVIHAIRFACGTNVAGFIEVAIHVLRDQHEHPHVELPSLNQHRTLNIFLNHKRLTLQDLPRFRRCGSRRSSNRNSSATIRSTCDCSRSRNTRNSFRWSCRIRREQRSIRIRRWSCCDSCWFFTQCVCILIELRLLLVIVFG